MITEADIEKDESLKSKLEYLMAYTRNSKEDCVAALNYSDEVNFAISWLYTTGRLVPRETRFARELRECRAELLAKAGAMA